jgi:superfamily II DNA or RNA helicase
MSFLKNYKREYESPEDNLAKDFIVPALSECKVYKRETAWFRSSALRAWAESLKYIVDKKKIKIEILAYPKIDMTTYRSLKDTSSKEKKQNIIQAHREKILTKAIDFEGKSETHSKETGKRIGELLSYLIAQEMLEIRFIQLGEEGVQILEDDNEDGLSHIKRGYFEFYDGTLMAFNGSANESHGGLMKQGEYMMVFDSRLEGDKDRVLDIKKKFDLTWEGKKPGVITEPISDKLLKRIKKFAPVKPPIFTEDKSEKDSTNNISQQLPKWLWKHQEEAIVAFLEKPKGILEMATGTGKTSTSLEIANQMIKKGTITKVLVCASDKRALLHQWVDELYEWVDRGNHNNVSIFQTFEHKNESLDFISFDRGVSFIVASRRAEILEYLFKNLDKDKTLIIQDEVHGLGAKGLLKLKGYQKSFKHTLGLSATPTRGYDPEGTEFIFDEIGMPVYEYKLEDAIKDKILCPFNYHPVNVELSENDNKNYQSVRAQYEHSLSTDRPWTSEQLATKLARVKNIAENKPDAFSHFINKNKELIKSSIIFCAEWEQADKICKELIKVSTSFIRMDANNKAEQMAAISNFGIESDCIVTCKALSEGIDIKSLKNIFLLSSNLQPLETIQRIGRCIRRDDSNPGKVANVIDFVVYRSIDDDNMIEADKNRKSWITEISKVRPNE